MFLEYEILCAMPKFQNHFSFASFFLQTAYFLFRFSIGKAAKPVGSRAEPVGSASEPIGSPLFCFGQK